MLSQSALARAWWPPCKGNSLRISLFGAGRVTVRPMIGDAVLALDACLRRWNYPTRAADTGAYVCREKVSGNGWSNHSYGTAIDINWQSNPYGPRLITNMPRGMVNDICAIRTNSGVQVWNWGGFWKGNKDAMHFEVVCAPADIRSGIRGRTVPTAPPPAPHPGNINLTTGDEDEMYFRIKEDGRIFHVFGAFFRYLDGPMWSAEVLLNDADAKLRHCSAVEFMVYADKRKLRNFDKQRWAA